MNTIKLTYVLLLAIAALTSCGDSFSTVVDVDLPDSDNKMAVHLDLKSGAEDTSYFNVVRLLSEVENGEGVLDYSLLDVAIQNKTTGESLEVLEKRLFDAYDIKAVVNKDINFNAGDEYTITLNYPDLEMATATARVQQSPPLISDIRLRRINDSGFDDEEVTRMTFTIQDPPEENFYRLRIKLTDQIIGLSAQGDTVSIQSITPARFNTGYSDDPSVFSTENGILISDKSFNGTTKEITINLQADARSFEFFGGIEDRFISSGIGGMYFEQISEDRYNFDRSLENSVNSDGGPFSTPVTVFSNIENGFGIFSISTADLYPLEY